MVLSGLKVNLASEHHLSSAFLYNKQQNKTNCMQSSFRKNLIIGFSLSLFLLLASAIASYVSIENLLVNARLVNKTHTVLADLEQVLAHLRDCETGQRGF